MLSSVVPLFWTLFPLAEGTSSWLDGMRPGQDIEAQDLALGNKRRIV